jgi:hypothetical protein
MAYEISEGAAAAAMFVSENELRGLNKNNIMIAMKTVYDNIKSNTKVIMSNEERTDYEKWFNPDLVDKKYKRKNKAAKLTAIVHGYSAALAIKEWMKTTHSERTANVFPGDVFVTGASFAPRIEHLKVVVGSWKDYNSSDIVIIKGNCYYGISLKKKDKNTSSNPPMINKSVINLLKELKKEKISKAFLESRIGWFGEVINNAKENDGPFAGSDFDLKDEVLLKTSIWNPYKSEYTPLINIKGWGIITGLGSGGKLSKENYSFLGDDDPDMDIEQWKSLAKVQNFFGYEKDVSDWKMRNFVNTALATDQNTESHLYYRIQQLANDSGLSEDIGKKLVQSVFKTELGKEVDDVLKLRQFTTRKKEHFGFALVTALGKVETYKKADIDSGVKEISSFSMQKANVKDNPVIQDFLSSLDKSPNWSLRIDAALTESKRSQEGGPPGKIFFEVGLQKGNKFKSVLDMEVRYKGSFTASPQFIGGMSEDMIRTIGGTELDKRLLYKFERSCI